MAADVPNSVRAAPMTDVTAAASDPVSLSDGWPSEIVKRLAIRRRPLLTLRPEFGRGRP
jgi:hypothetical protein